MPSTGIVISTQKPEKTGVFPRPGGTAWAISKAIDYPFIHMHRDAKAREDEIVSLRKISNNGIIYITGHGGSEIDMLVGEYVTQNTRLHCEWKFDQYCNLILDNCIEPINNLTIVLIVCHAGQGGINSFAAKLGNAFLDKGLVNTRIIASTEQVSRFKGQYDSDEDPTGRFKFKTALRGIRIFDCLTDGIIESQNDAQIYFTSKGIEGYSLVNSQKIQEPPALSGVSSIGYYPDFWKAVEEGRLWTIAPELDSNPDFIDFKDYEVASIAAKFHHCNIIKYLLNAFPKHSTGLIKAAFSAAAEYGALNIVTYCLDTYPGIAETLISGDNYDALREAAENGRAKIMHRFLEIPSVFDFAAKDVEFKKYIDSYVDEKIKTIHSQPKDHNQVLRLLTNLVQRKNPSRFDDMGSLCDLLTSTLKQEKLSQEIATPPPTNAVSSNEGSMAHSRFFLPPSSSSRERAKIKVTAWKGKSTEL